MGARVMEPGRYAQHPDGSWHMFTDKAALGFVPVACVKVWPRNPPLACVPDAAPAPETTETPAAARNSAVNAPAVAAPEKRHREVKAPRSLQYASPRAAPPKCTIIDNGDEGGASRGAAISEPTSRMAKTLGAPFKLGISTAPGSARSMARFKPMGLRDPDAEAAAAYDRAIQDGQAKR